MGSYNSDSHNVERIVDAAGFVRNEGDMQVAVKPYQIPYRVMLPKRAEARNLLVTAAFPPATSRTRRSDGAAIHDHRPGCRGRREAARLPAAKAVQEIDTAQLTKIYVRRAP